MPATLDVPYADTCAADLSWEAGHDLVPRDALAVLPLTLGDVRLELRLLAASHQVLLTDPHGGCAEVVACVPGRVPSLPRARDLALPPYGYHFDAEVQVFSAAELGAHVRAVATQVETAGGLVGAYPGAPDAVTALEGSRDGGTVTWRSWHAYPQTGELVRTRSEVTLP